MSACVCVFFLGGGGGVGGGGGGFEAIIFHINQVWQARGCLLNKQHLTQEKIVKHDFFSKNESKQERIMDYGFFKK